MFHDNARWWLLVIVIVAVALRLTLALVLPFDAAPDERWRYDVVRQIYLTGRAPRWGYDTPHHFVVKPIFGLRLNAFVAHAVPGHLPLGVKLRLGSVVWSLFTVVLAYTAVRNLWPRQPELAAALAALVAFLPQAIFIGSYLNHDAFTIFANTMVFYLLTVVHRRGRLTPGVAALFGLALGLVFLGRENGYAGFLLAAGYLLYVARQNGPAFRPAFLCLLAVFLLFPTGYYLQQSIAYGRAFIPMVVGSGLAWVPPGLSVEEAYRQLPVSAAAYPIVQLDWRDPVHWLLLLVWLMASSFGVFGYMDIWLPGMFYLWYFGLVVLGMSGLVYRLWARSLGCSTTGSDYRWLLGSAAAASVALVVAVLRHNFIVIFQPQGRYLLPLLVPGMLLLLLGWRSLGSKYVGEFLAAFGAVFFMVSGFWMMRLLVPFYT